MIDVALLELVFEIVENQVGLFAGIVEIRRVSLVVTFDLLRVEWLILSARS